MTVTVRPVPKRTYQNGIRPFRPVVPSNNIRPYTLKTWRPPVPEPLPPAPLLGPKELLLLGVSVVAQLWGLFGSRPTRSQPAPGASGGNVTGTMPPAGNTATGSLTIQRTAGTYKSSNNAGCTAFSSLSAGTFNVVNAANVVGVELQQNQGPCGPTSFTWKITYSGGIVQYQTTESTGFGFTDVSFGHVVTWSGPGAVAWATPTQTLPLPDGYIPPGPETEPQPAPPPPPLRKAPPKTVPLPPGVSPADPNGIPEIQPQVVPSEPGPKTPIRVVPAQPPTFNPKGIPGTTGTNNGALVPQAPATPTTTQADAHFPVPGAGPVTGNGPRPTPEGIAQELGRIEQKLARLSNPQTDALGDATDRLSLLLQLLRQLVEYFLSINAGGEYLLSSPCVVDATGDRIEYPVEYSGAPQALGVISNKIDALASLLQVHKDLKQPNCTQKGTGQPVQVNFIQVE